MKTDTDIRFEGIRALMQVLGTVEAERTYPKFCV